MAEHQDRVNSESVHVDGEVGCSTICTIHRIME